MSFNAHLAVGLCASGVAATSVMLAGMATGPQVILYFVLGTLGAKKIAVKAG